MIYYTIPHADITLGLIIVATVFYYIIILQIWLPYLVDLYREKYGGASTIKMNEMLCVIAWRGIVCFAYWIAYAFFFYKN
eukprot:UN14417